MAAVFQLYSLAADFGMEPAAAAHEPRIDVSGPDGVTADRRLPEDVLAALRADGPVELVEHSAVPINFACPNLIRRDAGGELVGDQRRGLALVGGGGGLSGQRES